jgi:hypothetical protein
MVILAASSSGSSFNWRRLLISELCCYPARIAGDCDLPLRLYYWQWSGCAVWSRVMSTLSMP